MKTVVYPKKQKKMQLIKSLLIRFAIYLGTLFLVIMMAYFCVRSFGMHTVIIDGSMNPGLQNEDVVLINSFAYSIGDPKRMDVVSFRFGSSENSPTYIRRIIGIPGDTLQVKDGELYINEEPVHIRFNSEKIKNPGTLEDGVTLADNEYFVIADNYNETRDDSRLESIGTIKEEQIIGKVWFRRSPLTKMKFVK